MRYRTREAGRIASLLIAVPQRSAALGLLTEEAEDFARPLVAEISVPSPRAD